MKIYDISQEVFSCKVFPGDPAPERQVLSSMKDDALYNLTALSMCTHNGTHMDAPYHFLPTGKTIDQIPIENVVGKCFVVTYDGELSSECAADILKQAKAHGEEAAKRILLKGSSVVSEAAAQVFADAGICLIGNESQTVGPEDAPMAVHKLLLGKEIVLLEGIRLQDVPDGCYFLFAAPLALQGADGSPCRAVLVSLDK